MSQKQPAGRIVHKFTDNAHMRFRPLTYDTLQPRPPKRTFTNTVSNILGGLFSQKGNTGTGKSKSKSGKQKNLSKNKSTSTLIQRESPDSSFTDRPENRSTLNQSFSKNPSSAEMSLSRDQSYQEILLTEFEQDNCLCFLQKVSAQTYLIGNQYQLDLITITGIYDNKMDTELNWNLTMPKKIKKVSVDPKKMLIAVEVQDEIHVYQYNSRKIKSQPFFLNKIRVTEELHYLLFLKDSIFGLFYLNHLVVYQVDDNNHIQQAFNKKYGVPQGLVLMQVPRPIQNILNIFFKEPSEKQRVHTLWRLEFDLRNITSYQNFKSLMRIYDIPNRLLKQLKISNYSRDIFIMNFKFEILAAKDGYIVDSANINIEKEGSYLIHHGESILLITDTKLEIYKFRIATNVKPNKIIISSQDSIQTQQSTSSYHFINCLEMFNGNFILFYQIKPHLNRKTKGEIDYLMTLTQKLTVAQKLSEIFDFKSPEHLRQIAIEQYQIIENKCDIAQKIGLSRKDIFLELWNKSAKSQVEDYKFLLDTLDYETIKFQIEKKLRKTSMLFRELYKLEQSCLQTLEKDVFSPKCSQAAIKHYIRSHFLLRKLQFYRDKHTISRDLRTSHEDLQVGGFTIDVQQYFNCANLQLKSYFLQMAFKLCFQQTNITDQLRFFLRSFRFPLRVIYPQLLTQLVAQSKNKLIKFLKTVPEILPFTHHELPSRSDSSLFLGLHAQILPEQWAKNLYKRGISTIYNREIIEEFSKTVWFKRFQYSSHDLISLSQQEIKAIQKYNASENIFYFFIQKIFEHSQSNEELEEVVIFLESSYEQLPQHLKGRIFLYRNLYNYFKDEQCHAHNSAFSAFLRMQDFQLFGELFKHQKVKKGCLLKDAKKIYGQMANGSNIYNQSLLHYFQSDLSAISDLKCILNRLNNQKRQFHIENEGIYEVLVKGMQTKLKLGSDNDIPLDEVMIYVENIPLTKNNPIIEELQTIQKINEEAERFKSIRLNMSFLQIMEQEETVISALLEEEIKRKRVMQTQDEDQFIGLTYQILAQIQIVKQKIYKDRFRDLQYFLYLNKLLESQHMIHFVKVVLNDPHLSAEYVVDEILIENLILFMYKWRLQEQLYVDHHSYVSQLVTILPEYNSIRKYIEAELAFAVMLSSPQSPVPYPLSISSQDSYTLSTIKLSQIKDLFLKLKVDFILELDLQELHSYIKQMELFYQEQIIKIEDIYEITIRRLLQQKAVRQAIPKIRELINLRAGTQNYSAVFCYLILNIIIKDIASEFNRRNFAKIAFHSYQHPLKLLDTIEERLNLTLSTDQEEEYFISQLQAVQNYRCYSPGNQLVDAAIMETVQEKEEKFNKLFQQAIFRSWDQVTSSRADFSQFQYTCVLIFVLHNPYALSKYISVNSDNLNLRIIRSYLSYLFKEPIFNGMNILLMGKRLFLIALENIITQLPVQYVTSQYIGLQINEDESVVLEEEPQSHLEIKLIKSIKAFNQKLMCLKGRPQKKQDEAARRQKIEDILSRDGSVACQKSQYPFNDSDDNYASDQDQDVVKSAVLKSNIKKVDKKLLREEKNLALFLSSCGEDTEGIRRTSPKGLRTSLAFHNQFQSLHLSTNFGGGRGKARKGSGNVQLKNQLKIQHTDSVAGVVGDYDPIAMRMSKENPPLDVKKDTMEEDMLYVSLQQKRLNPFSSFSSSFKQPQMQWSASPETTPQKQSRSKDGSVEVVSASSDKTRKIESKQSLVDLQLQDLNQNEHEDVVRSIQIPSMEMPDINFNIKVTVNQIDEEEYTSPQRIVRELLEDIDPNQKEPIFNTSLLDNEYNKEFDNFDAYLKKVVEEIYDNSGRPLSLLLQLIKQIQLNFPSSGVQGDFLKVYTALQSYNIKYRYNLPIRQMFPVEGIFLNSKDIKILFLHIKDNILNYVDFDNIMVVAKVIHFSFQKSEIKDELYYSYLTHAIQQYGSDQIQSAEELTMQRQRIGGIIEQLILVNIFVERGRSLLESVGVKERRGEIALMIVEALKRKKKDFLIADFEMAVQGVI